MKPQSFRDHHRGTPIFEVGHERIADAGRPNAVTRIKCCMCSATDRLVSSGDVMPADLAAQKFARRGWTIGKNCNHHKCPECSAKPKSLKELAKEVLMKSIPSEPILRAVEPRTMSFDDRRLIFSKLHDVYLDERRGYSDGWSDKRVGEDLNVPRAWVEKIRAENFGPTRDNEDIREFLAKLDVARAEASAVRGLQIALNEANKKNLAELSRFEARVEALETTLADLARAARNASAKPSGHRLARL